MTQLHIMSNSVILLVLTGIVIVVLILDGIIPSLPSYDLRTQSSLEIYAFFSIVVLVSAVSQLMYLEIIRRKYFFRDSRNYFKHTHLIVSVIQYTIIAISVALVLQLGILKQYSTFTVGLSAFLSLFLSVGITIFLSYRFFSWFRYNPDIIIAAYAAATLIIAVNSVVLTASILFELRNVEDLIYSSRIATSTFNITSFELKQFELNLSIASFVTFWLASVLLLRQSRSKWGPIKFYSIVTLPLLYYFGVFQLLFTQIFMQYDVLDAVQSYTFNLVNSFLTRPVGGILFGIAFLAIARSIENKNVSDYMKLASVGIMLLSISSEDTGLYQYYFPPFGLQSITFIGISSYLLFVGVYYSAVSISIDQKLRTSIQKSVEQQLRFVSKIATSQMEQEVHRRVKYLTKKVSDKLEGESGIMMPMNDDEVNRYIKFVIEEKESLSGNRKRDDFSDEEKS